MLPAVLHSRCAGGYYVVCVAEVIIVVNAVAGSSKQTPTLSRSKVFSYSRRHQIIATQADLAPSRVERRNLSTKHLTTTLATCPRFVRDTLSLTTTTCLSLFQGSIWGGERGHGPPMTTNNGFYGWYCLMAIYSLTGNVLLDLTLVIHGFSSLSQYYACLLYTSPSPRDGLLSRMPSSA